MRQKILVLLLIAGICAQSFAQFAIYLSYCANRQYITEKYCINKNKPTLHCLGKCHLKKVFTQSDADKENNMQGTVPVRVLWEYANNLFCQPHTSLVSVPVFPFGQLKHIPYCFLYQFLPVTSFFHPPPFGSAMPSPVFG